jgi:hypothetical protein
MHGKEVTISKGNYFGMLKGMEGEGFWHAVDWLKEEGLLPCFQEFVVDHDSSVQCTLNNDHCLQHICIHHDPGHTNNNVTKDLH